MDQLVRLLLAGMVLTLAGLAGLILLALIVELGREIVSVLW